MNKQALLSIAGIIAIVAFAATYSLGSGQPNGNFSLSEKGFEEKRTILLNGLSDAINSAKMEGKYSCCIEPPCTMCYLGNWLWNDGVCRCDEMIAKGEFDKVCPQCVKGIEEGKCDSAASGEETCEVPGGVF